MRKRDLISIRPVTGSDLGLIYSTWLHGFKYSNNSLRAMNEAAYFKVYHDVIESILNDPETKVDIACLTEDNDTILGYVVYTHHKLHWVFVRPDWREIGIAKDLVPKNITVVTHLTNKGRRLKPQHMVYEPIFKEAT